MFLQLYDESKDPDENILWLIEPAGGAENNDYYIMSQDGKYLNATYTPTTDPAGCQAYLKVDDTPDVWTLDGTLDDWVDSGSNGYMLKSTNASATSDKPKYMKHEGENVFTIRSSGDETKLVDPDSPGEFKYLVRFMDSHGNELRAAKYAADETPVYDGDTPVKEEDQDGKYDFIGWSDGTKTYDPEDALPKVTGAVTYTAQFKIHKHVLTEIEGKAATCKEQGNIKYWICDGGENPCGLIFADANGEQQINVEDTVIDIDKNAHDWGDWERLDGSQHQRVCKRDASHIDKANHTWDAGTITKEPTETKQGIKTYTCTVCDAIRTEVIPATGYKPGEDPNQTGEDGTRVGPGASAAAAEKAITSMKNDNDPKGAVFAKLKFMSPKQTKNSIKLNWTKVGKAKKYVIYGNKCGKTTKPKKLATVTGKTKTFKKVAGKKIKEGTYYKSSSLR